MGRHIIIELGFLGRELGGLARRAWRHRKRAHLYRHNHDDPLTLDRNHDLTDSKRNWQPTGPMGGVDVAELYPANFEEYFGYIDVWGWSAVLASSLVNGHPLRWTMYGLWKKYGFLNVYGIETQTFFNFADRLERSYGKVLVLFI